MARCFGPSFRKLIASRRALQSQLAGIVIGSGLAFASHDLDLGLRLLVSFSRSYNSPSRKTGDHITRHRTSYVDLSTSNGNAAHHILSVLTILFADLASIPFRSFSNTEIGFRGIHGHKNGLGGFCLFALPVFGLAIFDRRIARWPLTAALALICTVALLVFSHSKSAIGLSGVVTILLFAGWAFRWTGQYKGVFIIIYSLIAAAATTAVLATGLEETVALLTGDPTLTGKTTVWRYVLWRWEESPYLGQGFGALWQVGPELGAYLRHAEVTGWLMNEAHNGYLDVLAETGIVGLLLLGFFVLSGVLILLFTRQKEHGPNVWKGFAMYLTLAMLLSNITETGFFRGPDWLLFVAMCASALLSRGYCKPSQAEMYDPCLRSTLPTHKLNWPI